VLVRIIPLYLWEASTLYGMGGPTGEALARMYAEEEEAVANYLAEQAQAPSRSGVDVRTVAMRGIPAQELISLVDEQHPALVVMSTHGRTGFVRAALGSVADQLVRHSHSPILLLRSFGKDCDLGRLDRAVVALDGSPRAEQTLDLCRQLAGPVLRDLLLMRVVPDTQGETADEAQAYLDEVAAQRTPEFRDRDCTVSTKVAHGDPASEILREAEDGCNLIVIATHGRGGVARWALGSVADKIVQGARVPVLVVRSR
jgi:nucleotide-binding universal stress UspA family protein